MMISVLKPVMLRAKRPEIIIRDPVHGAPTPKGPIEKLESSLRSRRKLRLVWPENWQEPVCLRSPSRPTALNKQVGRNHFLQNLDDRGEADLRLSLPAPAHTIPGSEVIARLKSGRADDAVSRAFPSGGTTPRTEASRAGAGWSVDSRAGVALWRCRHRSGAHRPVVQANG